MEKDKIVIDKSIPIPLHYQLKRELLKRIESGRYPVGHAIPTESEIGEQLKISRSTVRQAILALVNEGWLERLSSKGTFVCQPKENTHNIRSFRPYYQQMMQTGKKIRTDVLSMVVQEAGSHIASLLHIPEKKNVIRLERLRFAAEIPMVLMLNYLPYELCRFILSHDFQHESLFEILYLSEDTRPKTTRTISSAIPATSVLARSLGIQEGDPILSLENISKTKQGVIIDYGVAQYRGDLNRFEVESNVSF